MAKKKLQNNLVPTKRLTDKEIEDAAEKAAMQKKRIIDETRAKSVPFNMRLPAHIAAQLMAESKRTGLSRSAIVIIALNAEFERKAKQ